MTTTTNVKWVTFGNEYESPPEETSETANIPKAEVIQAGHPQPLDPTKMKKSSNGRISFMNVFTLFSTIVILILLVVCMALLTKEKKQPPSLLSSLGFQNLFSSTTTIKTTTEVPGNANEMRMLTLVEILVREAGWYEASNGLLYKRFDNYANFELANRTCSSWKGRLASTGIRDLDIRE
uniref:uncharacterized protein LOC120339457 n=1 Tax=Styela clava TaxID=7725 RepID=UPI001939E4C0|nr:uncharacterized protein LOC120339457 [Styela clava]